MGYSLSDLGDDLKSGFDYLVNPFVAAGNDLLEKTGEWIIDKLTPDVDYNDRKLNSRSPTTPRRVIYGTARVGGQVIYIDSDGTDSKDLHMVVVLAGHYCDSIGDVYFGETISTDPKYSGKHQLYRSSDGTVPTALLSYLSSKGVNNYKYTNITYVYCVFNYDDEVYQGIPQITATVKGKQVYDPRTTLTEYSENAALCQLDWIKNYMGATDEFISEQSVIDAANISDELVAAANGSTEPRFALNGTISQSGSKIESLSKMSVNSGIFPAYRQGQWIFQPQVYVAPEVDAIISETELISDLSVSTGSDKQDKVNTIKGTYIDEATNFEQIEYPTIQTPTYLEEDKEQLEQSIDYPMVNSGTQCRRLSKVLLEQSRRSITVSGTFRFSVLDHEIGDRVKLSYAPFGWVEKIFKVTNRDISSFSGVELTLKEDDPDIYAWEEGDALETHVPPFLDLPNADFIAPPTNFTLTESLYTANTQAAVKARVNFAWLAGDTSARNYEIQGNYKGEGYQVLSSFISGLEFRYSDIETGEWIFRIRSVNSIGAKSTWVNLNYSVLGKTAPPLDVTGFTGLIKPFSIELVWDANPDIDIAEYEIRIGQDWENSELLQRLDALKWGWETRPTGNENLLIKAIDTTSNYSTNAAVASIEIQNPALVEPLTAKVVDNNVELRWSDATTSFNIDKYDIRRGDDFNTAVSLGSSKSTFKTTFEVVAGTFTYWVVGVDVQGNTGPAASVIANVDQPPDFVLQANQLINLNSGTKDNFISEIGEGVTADTDIFTADSDVLTADIGDTIVLVGPANLAETWDGHFESIIAGGTFPTIYRADTDAITADSDMITADAGAPSIRQLQTDNGFPFYLQPTPTTASYETTIDFLGTFNLSRIQLIPSVATLAGTPDITYTIGYSADDITYVDSVGLEATGVNFRYVRVKLDVSNMDNLGLIRVNSLRLRLDVKLKTDAGRVAVDGTGTANVPFNIAFVDIQSIQVSTNSTTNDVVTYAFADVPNPTDFDVFLFDNTGAAKAGEVSWNVRGV